MPGTVWKRSVLCGLLSLCGPGSLWGSEWQLAPTARLNVEHNDNWLLETENPDGTYREIVDLGLRVATSNGRDEINLRPAVRLYRYSEFSQYNDEVYSLAAGVTRNAELWTLSVQGDMARDSTLTSEYEEYGSVEAEKHRTKWALRPVLTRVVDPRTTVSAAISRNQVNYQDSARTSLVNYRADTVNLSWMHKYAERSLVRASTHATRLDAPDAGYENRDVGADAGLEFDATELLKVSVSAGVHQSAVDSKTVTGTITTNSRGWTFSSDLQWHGLRNWWRLALSRTIEPGARGVLVKQEQVALSLGHSVSTRLKAGLSTRVFRNTSLSDVNTLDNRTFARADASIQWAYKKYVDVIASYGRLQNDYESAEKAVANTVTVSVSYNGTGLSWWQ
jgi:hypothetical protein